MEVQPPVVISRNIKLIHIPMCWRTGDPRVLSEERGRVCDQVIDCEYYDRFVSGSALKRYPLEKWKEYDGHNKARFDSTFEQTIYRK